MGYEFRLIFNENEKESTPDKKWTFEKEVGIVDFSDSEFESEP